MEVIVVDDGSTEAETIEVLDRLAQDGTRVIRHEQNRGLSPARNTGLEAATTPYVFPLDADDLAFPGAIAAMADKLDSGPDAAVCFGDYQEFGDHEVVRAVPDRLDAFRLAYVNEYPVSALLRRSTLDLDRWLADDRGRLRGSGPLAYVSRARTYRCSLGHRQVDVPEAHPRGTDACERKTTAPFVVPADSK